ncbi:MAG TPA: DNA gyrase inhibitor YacG [Pirellulaceae bacterium]|nr:DNA gyrase inhibitor YacG [Pirellulaceae bacterium]
MTNLRCPICGKSFDPQSSQSLPFCSDRCRQIDLGRWLKEGYSVPVVRQPEDEEGEGARPEDDEPA